jgi:ribosome-associated protein
MRESGNDAADGELPEDIAPSKSARKREMTARQELGEALCQLSPAQLATIPIDDDALLQAIVDARSIHSRSAARRHRQFIGKLMRGIDPEPIRSALEQIHHARSDAAAAFHDLEELRDALLRDGDRALSAVLERFPDADRQQLRQLLRNGQRDLDGNGARGAGRRLFRYLRELQAEE